jgi:hypothetical protein
VTRPTDGATAAGCGGGRIEPQVARGAAGRPSAPGRLTVILQASRDVSARGVGQIWCQAGAKRGRSTADHPGSAAAAGVMVGMAADATMAAANTGAATSSAYSAGVAAHGAVRGRRACLDKGSRR